MNKILKTITMCTLAGGLLYLGGPASAQEQPQKQPQEEESYKKTEHGAEMSKQVTATAVIENIDKKNRTVTLRGPEGRMFSVQAGDQVKQFDKLKVGDKVRVTYNESLALSLRAPGEPAPSAKDEEMAKETTKGGELGREITATAEVVDVDKNNNTITLQGPEGRTWEMHVTQPEMQAKLDKLKKGDKIDAKYTENLAVSIEKA